MILLWPELQFGRLLSYKAGAPAGEIRPRRAAHIGRVIPMTLSERDIPTADLRQWLRYDADTGYLWWIKPPGGRGRMNVPAGCTRPDGRIQVKVLKRMFKAHRICWALHHGEWPTADIDHANGDPADNRICNLRLASKMENNRNQKKREGCTSGYKGVTWDRNWRKWRAAIRVEGQLIRLGSFDDEYQAHLAYCRAADEYFGEFRRYG